MPNKDQWNLQMIQKPSAEQRRGVNIACSQLSNNTTPQGLADWRLAQRELRVLHAAGGETLMLPCLQGVYLGELPWSTKGLHFTKFQQPNTT